MSNVVGGFSLLRMEINNWGNFHGWNRLDFLKDEENYLGPLFSGAMHSMIAGINGSGKSTLIDAIMVALLPFESSIRLGVTHDHEAGGGGGRKIKDYVLGKFSSSDGTIDTKLESIYGRQMGTSIVLLTFKHNTDPSRLITIGRVWWYQGYKVKNDSLLFLAHENLSIGKTEGKHNLADESGNPFNSARAFKKGMNAKGLKIQIFDKNKSYFQNLSLVFGNISKDDLKLLNRAFYVKSIGQINSFIKENMLLEADNEAIDRLIRSVETASSISRDIELCQKKISNTKKIIQELERYERAYEKKLLLDQEERLAAGFPMWDKLNKANLEVTSLGENTLALEAKIPELEEKIKSLDLEFNVQNGKLLKDDITFKIQNLEQQLSSINKDIVIKSEQKSKITDLCKDLMIMPPKKEVNVPLFLEDCQSGLEEAITKEHALDDERTLQKIKLEKINTNCSEVRGELAFLTKHKTLIPENIYSIKEDCIRSLALPHEALMFVGELISLNKGEDKYRKAVEAALLPISKNLLCHPDYLLKVTNWMNKKRLKSTITIKRITYEELEVVSMLEFDESSILNKLEVLGTEKNPFFQYLWNWLSQNFYHLIVDAKEFKKEINRAVTLDGLVKQDRRTMKKIRDSFSFCLGWDPKERIGELIKTLEFAMDSIKQIDIEIAGHEESLKKVRQREGNLKRVMGEKFDFFNLEMLESENKLLKAKLEEIKSKNHDYQKLKNIVEKIKKDLDRSNIEKYKMEGDLKRAFERIKNLEVQRVGYAKELSDFISNPIGGEGTSLLRFNESEKNVYSKFEQLQELFDKDATTSYELSDKIKIEAKSEELKIKENRSTLFMAEYKKEYSDPNLHYEVVVDASNADIISEWVANRDNIESTGLPQIKAKWDKFFNNTLIESIKTSINQIKIGQNEIKDNIGSINRVLKLTDYEHLPTEKRYLQIIVGTTKDDRIIHFMSQVRKVEGLLSSRVRSLKVEDSSKEVVKVLLPFVESLQEDINYRDFVVDVRNHFHFLVHSYKRAETAGAIDSVVETFSGAKNDAKSSAQTTQLAYALLASSLSYRFHLNDPVKGANTLRLIVLDEFGGKFDNEKPKDIVGLLGDMGFQAILVTPMSKVELLASSMSKLILVHKISAGMSKVDSVTTESLIEYKESLKQNKGAFS